MVAGIGPESVTVVTEELLWSEGLYLVLMLYGEVRENIVVSKHSCYSSPPFKSVKDILRMGVPCSRPGSIQIESAAAPLTSPSPGLRQQQHNDRDKRNTSFTYFYSSV